MPIVIKPRNFHFEVLQSELPVLVDFWGTRCVPCQMLRPVLLEISEELKGRLKVCMFNTDQEELESEAEYEEKYRTLMAYGITSLPTMLLFRGGILRRTLVGLHSREELMEALEQEGLVPPGPDTAEADEKEEDKNSRGD
ncbi:MAG: thioredoxin family protein [Oscillospiraceae bacterium]|nr:thioredoxin family protein [Oscillospiraceae bacterium]